ncbi:hypothetical protein TNIN_248281 [Trichonephila inaurata madagascariensis]|uniref:Uncharacterized protein n=1 Tax=Trichonephila inaurata madagascariensis TaxID=2747483 RepID=A0A8X7CJD3_9ARAC|nr:hypothetical protein TNIN_248281 [Trichonephila inaurata madagascariensis]
MAKLSLIFLVGALSCLVEQAYSNGYYYYPDTQGALSYQYLPSYSAYGYAPSYAFVAPAAADCDQKEEGESSSSSSSSEESSSSESKEGESKEEKKEEGGEEGEGKEGGEEKEEGSSSSSSEESGEGGEEKKEEKKEKKKVKVQKSIFPPTTYSFPPRPVQQVVYSAPASYPYVPYKAYSVVQAPVSYPVKSSYVSVPISSSYTAPMVKSYVPSQMTRIVSSPVSKIMTVPSVSKSYTFNPSSNLLGLSSYWAPSSNLGYYKA